MLKDPIPAETVSRIGRLVQTTTLSHRAIGRSCEVSATTVRRYIRLKRWSRPEGAPPPRRSRAARGWADIATLTGECLLQLKGQLSTLRRDHARSDLLTFNGTLRAITETTKTLKELARAVAALEPPPAPAGGESADDIDDEAFAAICDELAVAFERWRERGAVPLPPRDPGAGSGA